VSTFVLVHGAWHGGWCWERVAPRLRDAGHAVHAPTLLGLGCRSDELGAGVSLADHVADVVAELDRIQDDRGVVLVGHSYAGLVVRQAADQRPDRVRRIVLVDGWIAPAGAGIFDLAPSWFVDALTDLAERDGDGWLLPALPAPMFGVTDEADAAWLEPQLTAHPLRTFRDAAVLDGAVDAIPGAAIVCRPGAGVPFDEMARAVGYELVDIESGHDAMVTRPRELAEVLVGLA
jgi:pimeloyl-ACP methyl ester carboxylesterase